MPQETYSHGHHESVVRTHAGRTAEDSAAYLLPLLSPGMDLLDVGCGPGSITLGLARAVAPGMVTGLDASEEVVGLAALAAAERGVENARFRAGDVYELPWPDASFDVVHAHQVLHHLADPVAALREMRRVTRPGGLVAVREADFSAMSWYPQLPELDEWMDLYQQIARGNGAEPDGGRRLLGWALAAGFTDVEPSASNWLYATPQRRREHGGSWAERVLHSAFAEQALERNLADRPALERISAGWRSWAEDPAGWFLMPSAEVLARA